MNTTAQLITGIHAANAVNLCQDFDDQRMLVEMNRDEVEMRFDHVGEQFYLLGVGIIDAIDLPGGHVTNFYADNVYTGGQTICVYLTETGAHLRFDLTDSGLYVGFDNYDGDYYGENSNLEHDWILLKKPLEWFCGLTVSTQH